MCSEGMEMIMDEGLSVTGLASFSVFLGLIYVLELQSQPLTLLICTR